MGSEGSTPSDFEKVYFKLENSDKKLISVRHDTNSTFRGGLALMKYPKKDMAVTFSYYPLE